MGNKVFVCFGVFFVMAVSLWSQVATDLSTASQALGRNRWGTALDAQVKAMQGSAAIFLERVSSVLPLPKGMTNLEMTNSYYLTLAGDFADYEYQIKARLSNENFLVMLAWQYGLTPHERAYNFLRSLPYLSQASVWWRSLTNRGVVVTIWREKDIYSYLHVIEEKNNIFFKGFLIKMEIFPIKKVSSQVIENFVLEYVINSDWTQIERLLR